MKKPRGGIIHSDWITDPETDESRPGRIKRRCFGLAWGTVTEDCATRYNNTKKGKKAYVQFRLRLERGKFIRCTVYYGDPSFWTARAMKQGDRVFAIGNMVTYSYTNSEGENKIGVDFYPFMVFVKDENDASRKEEEQEADAFYGAEDADPDGEPYNPFDLDF